MENQTRYENCPYQPGRRINVKPGEGNKQVLVGCACLTDFEPYEGNPHCHWLKLEGVCPFVTANRIFRLALVE